MRLASLAVALLALVACVPTVTITPAGTGLALTPRPADCQIEFFRTRPPERPYDEVAALHLQAQIDDAAAAQEALRADACALGADAVVVTRDYALGIMTGTAVSYRDMREQHRVDAALRKAELERAAAAEGAKAAKQAAAKAAPGVAVAGASAATAAAPAGYVPARLKQTVTARASADRRGKEVRDLPAGTAVWVAAKPSSGWRRIWVPGEPAAWVEDDALEVSASPPAAPPAAPQKPRPTTDV